MILNPTLSDPDLDLPIYGIFAAGKLEYWHLILLHNEIMERKSEARRNQMKIIGGFILKETKSCFHNVQIILPVENACNSEYIPFIFVVFWWTICSIYDFQILITKRYMIGLSAKF